MGKALRAFVIVLLLLSVASLFLGILLFQKRELLKGRTQMLERYLTQIAGTIEAEQAEKGDVPADPEKDTSPVTAEVLGSPDRARFWESYKYELEKSDQSTIDLKRSEAQLRQYYAIDNITMKVKRDPTYGTKVTTGEGTMDNLLADTLKKAEEQLNRLNETREQLKALRQELIDTINDLNSKKSDLRDKLARIVEFQQQIATLEQRVADLQQQIAQLEEEKRTLQDTVAERERTIDLQKKDIAERDVAISRLKIEIRDLKRLIQTSQPTTSGDLRVAEVFLSPGEKGAVAALNPEWNFVVLKLNDKFLSEVFPPEQDRSRPLPNIELMLKRADGTFVTKVRITQIKPDQKIGVADNMVEWQQVPIEVGDTVFF